MKKTSKKAKSSSTVSKKTKKKDLKLYDLLITKLSVLHDVEKQLVSALPKMAKAASDSDLIAGYQKHLKETEGHVKRLEEIFRILNTKPNGTKSAAIRGLAEDAAWVIKNVRPATALDANLIAAASYVEHYEMAGYTSALEWAKQLDLEDVAGLLDATLAEEMAADIALAKIGKEKVNIRAQE